MRKLRAAIEHPRPVHALVELCCERLDFLVAIEISAARQDTAQQQRSIDRRNLAGEFAIAGVHIDEVKQKPALVRHFQKKFQRRTNSFSSFSRRQPAALIRDAKRRESETSGGGTGDDSRIGIVGGAAIFHQAGVGTCFLPEKLECRLRDFIEELVIGSGECEVLRMGRRLRRLQVCAISRRRDGRIAVSDKTS